MVIVNSWLVTDYPLPELCCESSAVGMRNEARNEDGLCERKARFLGVLGSVFKCAQLGTDVCEPWSSEHSDKW